MWRSVQPWLHVAGRARIGRLTSPWLRHFPSALKRGRGGTKDFAFSLAPSLHRPSSRWSFWRLALQTKMQKYEPRSSCTLSLLASEACVSVHGPLGLNARPPPASQKEVILQLLCRESAAALTWWAKAGSWKLLTWIRVNPCERTFFLLVVQRIVGNGVPFVGKTVEK